VTIETLLGAGTAVGAVLGGAGASVLAVESLRRRPLRSSVLVKRWQTWTVLALMWLVALSHPIAMFVVLAFVGTVSAVEYARLAGLHGSDRVVLTCLPVLTLTAISFGFDAGAVLIVSMMTATVAPILGQDVATGPRRIGRVALGLVVAVVPAGALWVLGTISTTLVLILLFGVALSDVVAFAAGSLMGGRKLAPILSPNKTWSGVAGNLVGATAGVLIASTVSPIEVRVGVVITVTIALGSIWGDLLESMLKRHVGVKDAGSMLPGFGGVLDRFDSLVMAAPLLLVVSHALEGVS
jgi:phosphatidate cytidylyltransferase